MAGNQQQRGFVACLPSKSSFGFTPKWPAISQEGLKWLLSARLQEDHLIFPPEWSAINCREGLWLAHPQNFHLVSPPNGRQSAEKV
jgi:hypothetical protein